ncbi:MAG: helix-turn-helix transcriptional regulator [Pseudomonadales bacterium]
MSETSPDYAFPRFLKFWRGVHSLSQEELAHRLDSSPRHISRLENGNGRPSEALVLDIAKVMNLGKRDSNHLLLSAGYAVIEEKISFHDPQMKWLRKAMTMTLKSLDPYPAVLLDSSANILMVNKGWVGFFSTIVPKDVLDNVTNHYDFLFSRQGAGKNMSAREDTLSVILMSLKQIALFDDDPDGYTRQAALEAHPNAPADWQQRGAKLEPMASFRVQAEINGVLRYFFNISSAVGAIGPAAYVSEPQLSVSTLYPEDEDIDLSPLISKPLQHPLLLY